MGKSISSRLEKVEKAMGDAMSTVTVTAPLGTPEAEVSRLVAEVRAEHGADPTLRVGVEFSLPPEVAEAHEMAWATYYEAHPEEQETPWGSGPRVPPPEVIAASAEGWRRYYERKERECHG